MTMGAPSAVFWRFYKFRRTSETPGLVIRIVNVGHKRLARRITTHHEYHHHGHCDQWLEHPPRSSSDGNAERHVHRLGPETR
jgi:hypothetical protein